MTYSIKDTLFLKKILWIDALMGSITAIIGLVFFNWLTHFLGLSKNLIIVISSITLMYAIVALVLSLQKNISIPLLRLLVNANWVWTFISVILFFIHFNQAEVMGVIFLILQVFVVGGLAYLEGNQISSFDLNY